MSNECIVILAVSREDYTESATYYELTSSSGHCFNISLINDDIKEPIEDFGLSLHVISSLSPVLVDPTKRTTSIVIFDGDGNTNMWLVLINNYYCAYFSGKQVAI